MPRPESFLVGALLTGLVAFGPLSTDLYLPSLPGIARDLVADASAVQLTLSVFLLGFAVGQILYGPLSDRFGRRPVLLGGIAIYLAGTAACAFAPTIQALIAARFAQAVGACSGVVLTRAIVRDLFAPERGASVMAYLGSAMAIGPMIGPIIGGQLEIRFGWRANFILLALFGAAMLVAVVAVMQETNRNRDPSALSPRRMLGNFREMLAARRFLGCTLTAAFVYGGLFTFISVSAFVLIDVVGLTPDLYGFCFAAMVVGYMVGALSAGRVVQQLGIDRVMLAGGILAGGSGVTLAILAWLAGSGIGVVEIVAPMMVYGAGVGWVLPASSAAAVGAYPDRAGAASSLLGAIQMCVAAGIGALVGHLLDGTARPMALAIALCGLGTLAAILSMRRDRLNSPG
jgi:DHA1 family bicyclomycin/chloramphenicol resistance-like MFS transporter